MAIYVCKKTCFFQGRLYSPGEKLTPGPGVKPPKHFMEDAVLGSVGGSPKTPDEPKAEAKGLTASGLAKLKKEELQVLADERKVRVADGATKDQIIEAILTAMAPDEPKAEA